MANDSAGSRGYARGRVNGANPQARSYTTQGATPRQLDWSRIGARRRAVAHDGSLPYTDVLTSSESLQPSTHSVYDPFHNSFETVHTPGFSPPSFEASSSFVHEQEYRPSQYAGYYQAGQSAYGQIGASPEPWGTPVASIQSPSFHLPQANTQLDGPVESMSWQFSATQQPLNNDSSDEGGHLVETSDLQYTEDELESLFNWKPEHTGYAESPPDQQTDAQSLVEHCEATAPVQQPTPPQELLQGQDALLDEFLLNIDSTAHRTAVALCPDTPVSTEDGGTVDDNTSRDADVLQNERENSGTVPSESAQPQKNALEPDTESLLSAELASRLDELAETYSVEDVRRTFLETHDKSWSPPSNDITIPSDRQDAIKHVQRALRAMASTKKAVDSRKDNSFKSRYAKKKMGETVYDPVKMTIRCWDIVNLAIDLHNKGPSVLHCFDSQYASNFASTRKWTFQQRIDAIVYLFETRKSRCDVAIKGENLYTVVGNPDKLNRTSIQNGVSNTIKAGEIKRGKEAKQNEAKTNAVAKDASVKGAANLNADTDAAVQPNQKVTSTSKKLPMKSKKLMPTGKGRAAASQQMPRLSSEPRAPLASSSSSAPETVHALINHSPQDGNTLLSEGSNQKQSTYVMKPNVQPKRKLKLPKSQAATSASSAAKSSVPLPSTVASNPSAKKPTTVLSTLQPSHMASSKRRAEHDLEQTASPKRARTEKDGANFIEAQK